MFYNGLERKKDEYIQKLSDAFEEKKPGCIELTVRVININYGHSKELMDKCRPLSDYSYFIAEIRRNMETMPMVEAVRAAVEECIAKDILKEFLLEQRSEVIAMSIYEYNEEYVRKVLFEDGVIEGRAEGFLEGKEAGLEKGRKVGLEEGKKAGLEEGREIGIEEGKKAGLEEGRKVGLEEGKRAGLEEGRKAGLVEGMAEIVASVRKMYFKSMQAEEIADLLDKEIMNIKNILKLIEDNPKADNLSIARLLVEKEKGVY